MKKYTNEIRRFIGEENGPTATEYALLLALIAAAVVVALATFGDRVQGIYDAISGAVDA